MKNILWVVSVILYCINIEVLEVYFCCNTDRLDFLLINISENCNDAN